MLLRPRPGLGILLPWCLAACLLPWSFYWPLAVAQARLTGLGWWRKAAPRGFPGLAPFCLGFWFLVVLLFFSRRRHLKLLGYIPALGAWQGALLNQPEIVFWDPCRGSPGQRAIALIGPSAGMGSFQLPLVLAVIGDAPLPLHKLGGHRIRPLPDFFRPRASGGASKASPRWLALVLAVRWLFGFFSLLGFQKKVPPRCFSWPESCLGFRRALLLLLGGEFSLLF